MLKRLLSFSAAGAVLLAACVPFLQAQTAPAPNAYTVTVTTSLGGAPSITKTYRQGSKVLVDRVAAADASRPGAAHTRSFYDLQTHKSLDWSTADASGECSIGSFSGDWGDPFTSAASMIDPSAKQVGTETIRGLAAKIVEVSSPSAKVRAWVDIKYGLLLKAQMTPTGGATQTVIEVTGASFTPPPASVFVLSPSCAATAKTPLPPTEAEEMAALTGGNAQNFVKAIEGPGTKVSCKVIFKVVKAGSLQPIAANYQVALDLNIATEPTPQYDIGLSTTGKASFSGGGLHEVTSQMHNGELQIDNPPAQFDLEAAFGAAGSTSALIYRKCYLPTTELLYVLKNPNKITDGGEFLWVKSGRY